MPFSLLKFRAFLVSRHRPSSLYFKFLTSFFFLAPSPFCFWALSRPLADGRSKFFFLGGGGGLRSRLFNHFCVFPHCCRRICEDAKTRNRLRLPTSGYRCPTNLLPNHISAAATLVRELVFCTIKYRYFSDGDSGLDHA